LRRLADAGVSLRVAVPIGMSEDRVQLALGAADPVALKAALGS
jgi:tRNA threonylcarbamoyladenosine modification (KEOPS) complex  Pcc1 subunit